MTITFARSLVARKTCGVSAGKKQASPAFISKLHDEVLMLHGEARNFSSILRCTCLVYLERQVALPVAAE